MHVICSILATFVIQGNYILFKIKTTYYEISILHAATKLLFPDFCSGHSKLTHTYLFKGDQQPECIFFLVFWHYLRGIYISCTFLSVGLYGKWCPLSRITPLARRRSFHGISTKSRLMRAARVTLKFQIWLHLRNSRRRRYMAEILPFRRKIKTNQSI